MINKPSYLTFKNIIILIPTSKLSYFKKGIGSRRITDISNIKNAEYV